MAMVNKYGYITVELVLKDYIDMTHVISVAIIFLKEVI